MCQRAAAHHSSFIIRRFAFTRELMLKAGELDLLRIDIPEAYGGLGLDKVSSAYVGEKIGVMPSFAGSLGAHTAIGTLPLVYFGTPEQKARYLPKLASGEMIGAFALTEPGSGSDALAARTRATLDGDHYVLNGQKMWITNGGFADLFTIFAKVDGEKFTAFLVERAMGVVSGREEPKLGLDGSSTTALILENVRVPASNVLGKIGEGHKVAFNVLNIGRLKLGTRNIGSAKQSLNRAMERTAKMKRRELAGDMTLVYTEDAKDRMWHSARQAGWDEPTLANRPLFDTIAARRRIADTLLKAGKYPL